MQISINEVIEGIANRTITDIGPLHAAFANTINKQLFFSL